MQGMVEAALANPWAALNKVLDEPLHPGGRESTMALLERAGVDASTQLVDAGCGAGQSVALAETMGAEAIGLDRDPSSGGVRGDLSDLPLASASVDVALAECVMCLVDDRQAALGELRHALRADGRLALSDVVVEGDPPDLDGPIARAVCLSNSSGRDRLVSDVESAGFRVGDVQTHRDDLLAMRDRIQDRVDYKPLLALLGERGTQILDQIDTLETAVESGRVGYVSLVASPTR